MAANSIGIPYTVITNTDGTALEAGYIYIGTVNLDPELNPVTIYWDKAMTITAAQPVRTINGYFSNSGTPGSLYVDADDYSMTVRNKNSVLEFTSLVNTGASATVPSSLITGQFDASRIDFEQTGTGFVSRTVEDKFEDIVSVKDFGALGDGANDDTAEIQAALDSISNGVVHIPAGTYNVSTSILVRTKNMVLKGDGIGVTKIVATSALTNIIELEDPSYCTIEDIIIDGDNSAVNGLKINDGKRIYINKVLVKNLTGAGFDISNVDELVMKGCGGDNTDNAAFNFIATAALDSAAIVSNGVRAVLYDCNANNYDTGDLGKGAIYTNQGDTSSIDVMVHRFRDFGSTASISIGTGTVHLDHNLQLIDCIFTSDISGVAISFAPVDVFRTGSISVTGANTPIVKVGSLWEGATNYGGELMIVASNVELSSSAAKKIATYLLLVSDNDAAVDIADTGYTTGGSADEPSFTFALDIANDHIEATPVALTSGTFYFYVTQIGGMKLSKV